MGYKWRLGYCVIRSLILLHRTLIWLSCTALVACALCCAHSSARLITPKLLKTLIPCNLSPSVHQPIGELRNSILLKGPIPYSKLFTRIDYEINVYCTSCPSCVFIGVAPQNRPLRRGAVVSMTNMIITPCQKTDVKTWQSSHNWKGLIRVRDSWNGHTTTGMIGQARYDSTEQGLGVKEQNRG